MMSEYFERKGDEVTLIDLYCDRQGRHGGCRRVTNDAITVFSASTH